MVEMELEKGRGGIRGVCESARESILIGCIVVVAVVVVVIVVVVVVEGVRCCCQDQEWTDR